MAERLSTEDVARLKDRLMGQTSNVHQACWVMFGFDPGESVFATLATEGVAKCVECDVWQTFPPEYLAEYDMPICDDCASL